MYIVLNVVYQLESITCACLLLNHIIGRTIVWKNVCEVRVLKCRRTAIISQIRGVSG